MAACFRFLAKGKSAKKDEPNNSRQQIAIQLLAADQIQETAPIAVTERPKSSAIKAKQRKVELELFASARFNSIDVYVKPNPENHVFSGSRYDIHYRNPKMEVAWQDCIRKDICKLTGYAGRWCTIFDLEPETTYEIMAEVVKEPDESTIAESKVLEIETGVMMAPVKCYKCCYDFDKRDDREMSVKVGDILEEDLAKPREYEDFASVKNLTTGEEGLVPLVYIERYPSGDQPKIVADQDYYFNANRRKAEVWLIRPNVESGRFLIRPASDKSCAALSVRFPGDSSVAIGHYKIFILADGYGCYVDPSRTFEDIEKLIKYYKKNSVSPDRDICLGAPFPKNPKPPKLADIKIPAERLTNFKKLAGGNFGEVFKANFDKFDVAVKKLLPSNDEDLSKSTSVLLIKEAEAMASFFHDNLVRLIGVCIDNEPYMIVSELVNRGALLDFLKDDYAVANFQLVDVVFILSQVACGMTYLEEENIVHRDLRAANVLVHDESGKLEIKITDFGLSRILNENNSVYQAHPESLTPIRWTAPEGVRGGRFSVKSDVWSFGILAVEVMTLGTMPYRKMVTSQIVDYVCDGGRITAEEVQANKRQLSRSPVSDVDLCPEKLFNEVQLCWKIMPEERPTFAALYDFLENYDGVSDYMY